MTTQPPHQNSKGQNNNRGKGKGKGKGKKSVPIVGGFSASASPPPSPPTVARTSPSLPPPSPPRRPNENGPKIQRSLTPLERLARNDRGISAERTPEVFSMTNSIQGQVKSTTSSEKTYSRSPAFTPKKPESSLPKVSENQNHPRRMMNQRNNTIGHIPVNRTFDNAENTNSRTHAKSYSPPPVASRNNNFKQRSDSVNSNLQNKFERTSTPSTTNTPSPLPYARTKCDQVPYNFEVSASTPPTAGKVFRNLSATESKNFRINSKPDVTQISQNSQDTQSSIDIQRTWKQGSKAMAHGLNKEKQLNNKVCTVEKVDENGFIHVRFDDIVGKGSKWKLMDKNLMPVLTMQDSDSDSDDGLNRMPSYLEDSDDEEINQQIGDIENTTPVVGEPKGKDLNVVVRCSPKKTNVSSLPKIGKKVGKKAHLWAVTVGNETFYARRTALVKARLINQIVVTPGTIKKKLTKSLQKHGETRAKAMMRLAERITFQEQSANLWVMCHFGALF